jgi:hypothetical protein
MRRKGWGKPSASRNPLGERLGVAIQISNQRAKAFTVMDALAQPPAPHWLYSEKPDSLLRQRRRHVCSKRQSACKNDTPKSPPTPQSVECG